MYAHIVHLIGFILSWEHSLINSLIGLINSKGTSEITRSTYSQRENSSGSGYIWSRGLLAWVSSALPLVPLNENNKTRNNYQSWKQGYLWLHTMTSVSPQYNVLWRSKGDVGK